MKTDLAKRGTQVRTLSAGLCWVALMCGAAGPAAAQASAGPVVYPAKGQSAKQQDQDRYECHGWAREQSGFDPTQPASAANTSTGRSGSTSGDPTGGMVKGALGGAAAAELGHRDVARGAAVGVVGATVLGRVRERQAAQTAQQQAAQQQQAARAQQRALYERAFGACMEARGYTVR